jgi:hypothetical protein
MDDTRPETLGTFVAEDAYEGPETGEPTAVEWGPTPFPDTGDGVPLFPDTGDGVPLFPDTGDGVPLFPDTGDGVPLFPGTGDGVPLFPGTGDGVPLFPGTGDGVPLFPGTGDGVPLFPGTGDGVVGLFGVITTTWPSESSETCRTWLVSWIAETTGWPSALLVT